MLSLGACASEEGVHSLELGPGAIFKTRGVSGRATIKNRGPAKIEVTAEHDDGKRFHETRMSAKTERELDLDDEDTLQVTNIADEGWASVRIAIEDD